MNNIESTLECFKDLNQEDLDFISQNKTQIEYQKGDTIFKQGAFASHILFINKGLARVYLQTAKNKQLNIHLVKEGDFMAFSTIFGDQKYNYSAIALVDSVICMIDKKALKHLLLRNPEFAMQITIRNSYYESRFFEIIQNITAKQMRGKLASALLYIAFYKYKDENVFNHLTRQDISDFAAITVESTVKFLKEFEREGIIELKNKEITIRDLKRLNYFASKG